jgi:hypothetical protein
MKHLLILTVFLCGSFALADELIDANDRDPASVGSISTHLRNYPGGADEEDLKVQAHLPEASMKTDFRSVQRGVYKTLYNQELKDERTEPVEE